MPVYKSDKPTKDGRQYFFKVSTPTLTGYKQYKSKKYLTAKECKAAEAKYILSKDRSSGSITFNALVDNYLQSQMEIVKPQTVPHLKNVCKHITDALGNIKVEKMTKRDYEDFRDHLTSLGLSANYKNKINTQLKCLLKYAYKNYDIRNDIPDKYGSFIDGRQKEKIDFYTLDEFNQFISVVDDPRYKALFTTLFFLGLRIGEANALQFKDYVDGYVHIDKTVNTKIRARGTKYLFSAPKTKSSIRNLPVPKRVAECLKMMREHWSMQDGFTEDFFIFGGVWSLPETSITKAKNHYCELAGLRQIRIHDFRHSCASLLINNGANVTLVSNWLGHADTKMTLNTYSHLWKSRLDEIAVAIDLL